jgi:hypothetical protein
LDTAKKRQRYEVAKGLSKETKIPKEGVVNSMLNKEESMINNRVACERAGYPESESRWLCSNCLNSSGGKECTKKTCDFLNREG